MLKPGLTLVDVLEGDAPAAILEPGRRMLLGPEELEGVLEVGLANFYMDPVFSFFSQGIC